MQPAVVAATNPFGPPQSHLGIPKPAEEMPPKTTTPFQVKLANGETFTAQLSHFPAHSRAEGSLASVAEVREAVEKATGIPTANQTLLLNGQKMVQSKEREQIALLLEGDQCVTVIVKEAPPFSPCNVHAGYSKDCLCVTCSEIMCAKCGIRHAASPAGPVVVSHLIVDMTDEDRFHDVLKESINQGTRSIEQLTTERSNRLASSMTALNVTLTLLEAQHKAVLEAELAMAEATMLADQWESCERPIDIATFLAAEFQRKKKLRYGAVPPAACIPVAGARNDVQPARVKVVKRF
jgi:hypothetical protein